MMARQMQAAQGQFGAQAQVPQQQQQPPPPQQQQQLDLVQWQQIAAQQHAQQQYAAAAQQSAAGWGGATVPGSNPTAPTTANITEPSVPAGAEPENPKPATAELDAFIQQLATRAAELYARLGPHATVVQTLTTLVVACHRGGYKRDAELAAGQLWEVIRASRFPGGVGETPEGIAVLRAQLGAMMDQALGAEGAAMLAAAGGAPPAGGDASGLAAAAAAAAQSTQYAAITGVGAH